MGVQNNGKTKPRRRKTNQKQYVEQQRKKKVAKRQHESKNASRQSRTSISRQYHQILKERDDKTNKSIIIVTRETERTDTILFKINHVGESAILLDLPVINDGMIEPYFSAEQDRGKAIIDCIKVEFGVEANQVFETNELVILKGCKILERKPDYVVLTVKYYDYDPILSVNHHGLRGRRMYSGAMLNEYLAINGDISKLNAHHDTFVRIIMYRELAGKMVAWGDF
ncbi:hypothetical protein IJM16_02955 [Candidatus Saccharibacteria bacterium]|nr:hypothetical protein [Candidatus Saccharibacteria bacterium]